MKTELLISSLGLGLSMAPGVVHGLEMVSPMLSRWVVNWVLPPFGLTLPDRDRSLTYDEQITMLDAELAAAPAGKETAGADYVFLKLFEQRQGAIAFLSVVAGALYGLMLPLADRHPLHLLLGVMAVLFCLVNANHAGVPLLGHHPKISRNGRNVGIVFTGFWAIVAALNGYAFWSALG